MIEAIIFDCFGVLTIDKWKEFASTLPDNQRVLAGDINHAYDRGLMTEKEFISKVQELTGRDPGIVEELNDQNVYKNNPLLSYIGKLRMKYKIGLLSNVATNWVCDKFLTNGEQKLFDKMIFSFEVGMTKPDLRIFKLAAQRLGVEPDKCVFIDDIERYCDAARSIGMQAIVYKDFEQTHRQLEQILT